MSRCSDGSLYRFDILKELENQEMAIESNQNLDPTGLNNNLPQIVKSKDLKPDLIKPRSNINDEQLDEIFTITIINSNNLVYSDANGCLFLVNLSKTTKKNLSQTLIYQFPLEKNEQMTKLKKLTFYDFDTQANVKNYSCYDYDRNILYVNCNFIKDNNNIYAFQFK